MFLKSVEDKQKRDEERKEKSNNFKDVQKNYIYRNVYNTRRWQKLRLIKLKEKPLCERCFENGLFVLASCVHHKQYISDGKNNDEIMKIGFDYSNLESLCKECHKREHNPQEELFLFD